MKIFISWSGERARYIARILSEWLPHVLHSAHPWMSDKDIHAGATWLNELSEGLADTTFGLVCVTPENVESPWILFEAGAMSRALPQNRVCPLLFDMDLSQLKGPLSIFQAKLFTEEGLKGVVDSIATQLGEQAPSPEVLQRALHKYWPDLQDALQHIPELKTKQDPIHTAKSYLNSASKNFDEMVSKYKYSTKQVSFLESHIRTLSESIFFNSERLRYGDIVTDYDDCSLLTSFVAQLQSGDEMVGLTDWNTDASWWTGVDAKDFIEANKQAIQQGARICRVFVHPAREECTVESLLAMKEAMQAHCRLGIEVYEIESNFLYKKYRNCPLILSQCVLSSSTGPEGRLERWLTYNVEHDIKRYPQSNVYSINPTKIETNHRMLTSILSWATRWHVSQPDECGTICGSLDYDDDSPGESMNLEGRRLYIHQDSFFDLANQSEENARLVYGALASIPVVKLAFHDLSQDAVYLTKELTLNDAERLTTAISKRWYSSITNVLRKVAIRNVSRLPNSLPTPLLNNDEWVRATCFDDNYYTFATSEEAAKRMFTDMVKMSEVRRMVREGHEAYLDLTLVKGRNLILIPEHSISGAKEPLATMIVGADHLSDIKQGVAETFEKDLRNLVAETMQEMSNNERAAVERFIIKCTRVVRHTVLSLPVSA